MTRAWLLTIALAGCGGGSAPATSSTAPSAGTATAGAPEGEIVPPETMDEINRLLERKRTIVAHCLAVAVDNKELPKSSRGKVTVALVIAPHGKADRVEVVRATLESQSLNACVIKHVRQIQFPELAKPYETSYTYGFEAM